MQHKYEEYDAELDPFSYLRFYHGRLKALYQKDGERQENYSTRLSKPGKKRLRSKINEIRAIIKMVIMTN